MATKSRTISINTDLTGFGSASRPLAAHRKIMGRYASPLLGGPRAFR